MFKKVQASTRLTSHGFGRTTLTDDFKLHKCRSLAFVKITTLDLLVGVQLAYQIRMDLFTKGLSVRRSFSTLFHMTDNGGPSRNVGAWKELQDAKQIGCHGYISQCEIVAR
jgi:hypothetical protein